MRLRRLFKRGRELAAHAEDAFLVTALSGMILIAATQILLRNLFNEGISWGDPLVRVLVLWVGLAGAMVASRQQHHITLDMISRHLHGRRRCLALLATQLFTALVSGVIAYHAVRLVYFEYLDGGLAFAFVPSWVCQLILPFAFAVIALRALALAGEAAYDLWRGQRG